MMLSLVLSLVVFLPPVYLQIINSSENCSPTTLAAKTVYDFWHESSQECEFEVQNLLKIHKRVLLNAAKQNVDQISDLVDGHVRSALRQYLFKNLMTLITTKTLSTQPDIENVFDQLYSEPDKSLLLDVWQKVLDESFLFMSRDDILQEVLMLTNGELKLLILDYMLKKYEHQGMKSSSKFLPLLTFGVTSVLKDRVQAQMPLADPSFGRLVAKLPEQLLIIFQSWNYNVSVLNSHSNEYIFSERDNHSAAGNKRFLFSFLPGRNIFRVKGKFKMQINTSGLITLTAPYNRSYGYLMAEQGTTFICLDCALTAAQWWQVLWPHTTLIPIDQQFVMFQNVATQELLCSSNMAHDDLISIATANASRHLNDAHCLWKVVKRAK